MPFRLIIMVLGRLAAFAICFCLLGGSLIIRADDPKALTAEQIAEGVIVIAGNGYGRAVLNQIRRNGIERGRSTRIMEDGRSEEARYELRFVRGDKSEKDKVRIDNKTAQAERSEEHTSEL